MNVVLLKVRYSCVLGCSICVSFFNGVCRFFQKYSVLIVNVVFMYVLGSVRVWVLFRCILVWFFSLVVCSLVCVVFIMLLDILMFRQWLFVVCSRLSVKVVLLGFIFSICLVGLIVSSVIVVWLSVLLLWFIDLVIVRVCLLCGCCSCVVRCLGESKCVIFVVVGGQDMVVVSLFGSIVCWWWWVYVNLSVCVGWCVDNDLFIGGVDDWCVSLWISVVSFCLCWLLRWVVKNLLYVVGW